MSAAWEVRQGLSHVCHLGMKVMGFVYQLCHFLGPSGASGKEPTCQCRRHKRHGFDPWVVKIPLEEGMATDSSILAWRIPRTEEPGGLQSTGSQRFGHD